MREERSDMSEDDERGGGSGSTGSTRTREGESPSVSAPCPDQVLENVLESVLCFLTSRRDRNAASLVCKSWYHTEALTRSELFIGNCYAVSPQRAIERFTGVQAVVLKGKPRFADFDLVPEKWGAFFRPWAVAMGAAYPRLENLCLKRMRVTNEDLSIVARSLPMFKELVLICCDGFGTIGLAEVASTCRQLRVLDLSESVITDEDVDWISCFPETTACLESLTFDCVESEVNFESLERLVARSPMLKKLRLNQQISVGQLQRLMLQAPHLTHLGTGSFRSADPGQEDQQEVDLSTAFSTCKAITSLSGFRDILPDYLPAITPVCANLTSLNFSYANINSDQIRSVILHCHKLQKFWALDSIRDEGLQAVASTCMDLRELRVFPMDAREDSDALVSEVGLIAISKGCKKLRSILYFCQHMTNAAVITMSMNCPELVVFRLCIMGRHQPDHLTDQPMDEGFGAIVMNCKKLTRLSISGLLTDKAFAYIGKYGKLVRTLSVAFAGETDNALRYVLEGCANLQKLEIRDCPFGDEGLLSGLHHYYNMRFLWMSSCKLSLRGCKEVARRLPQLVVEVIEEEVDDDLVSKTAEDDDNDLVEKLYMYRSLAGPRKDAPKFVKIL
ncbi:transport inhibitor response 1-like protein [Aristolochia californica]|uniref:transport inhibitor response 1-like protein n=1 Tax=Aristolochia californica TaxID=171875 RepID=UPI0035DDB41F